MMFLQLCTENLCQRRTVKIKIPLVANQKTTSVESDKRGNIRLLVYSILLLDLTGRIVGIIVEFLRLRQLPIHVVNKHSKKRPFNDINPTEVVSAQSAIKFPDSHQPTEWKTP